MYEARYGFTPRTVVLVFVSLVFVGLGFLPGLGALYRFAIFGLFGGGVVAVVLMAASGYTALRVDWNGVTLGGSPLRRSQHAVVPWSDITGITLWVVRSQTIGNSGRTPMVTLLRRPGSPRLPGRAYGAVAREVYAAVGGPGDLETINASAPVQMWKLDRAQFVATVARYAPHVPVTVAPDFPK